MSTKVCNAGVQITAKCLISAVLICMFAATTVHLNHLVEDTNVMTECFSLFAHFYTSGSLFAHLIVHLLCLADQWRSITAAFCNWKVPLAPHSLVSFCVDKFYIQDVRVCLCLLLVQLSLVAIFYGALQFGQIAYKYGVFSHSKKRTILAARCIKKRRYRCSRVWKRRWAAGPRKSSCRLTRLPVFVIALVMAPILRLFSVGDFACKGLTPRSKACNAGDGPGAGPNPPNDAWAEFLKRKSLTSVQTSKPKKVPVPERSRWTDSEIDLQHIDGHLKQLNPDDFRTNATGVALLTRQLFRETATVRSKAPLAVILPGETTKSSSLQV